MNDEEMVVSARLGMSGLYQAEELLEQVASAANDSEKIDKLTLAVRILVAHLNHEQSEREMDKINRSIGNI